MTVSPMLQRILYLGLKANFITKNAMRVFITRVDLNDISVQSSSHKAFVDAMERQRTSTIEVNNAVLMHAM